MAPRRGLPLRARRRAVAGRRRAGRRLRPAGRHPHRAGRRDALSDQRRAVLLHRLRQARGHRRARQGARRRIHGPRLRVDGVARRELVPHVALPVRRGRARLRRSPRHRGDRRDRGRGPEHGPGRRCLRHAGIHDVLRGHDQRRHARGPPPGDRGADRARQEPPVRRAVEHRQRARVRDAERRAPTSSRSRPRRGGWTRRVRSASST